MTEPQPTLAGYGEILVLQQVGCGLRADESFPEDQWYTPQDVERKSYYRTSQGPRLIPVDTSTVDTSYQKAIGPGNPPKPVR